MMSWSFCGSCEGVSLVAGVFDMVSSIASVSGSPIASSSCRLCCTISGMVKVNLVSSPRRGEEGGVNVRMGLMCLVSTLLPSGWAGGEGALDVALRVALLFAFVVDLLLRVAMELGLPRTGMFLPVGSSHSGVGGVGGAASCCRWIVSSRSATIVMSKLASSGALGVGSSGNVDDLSVEHRDESCSSGWLLLWLLECHR